MKPSIFYPVNPFFVGQHFGENTPCVRDFGLPTQSIVGPNGTTTCPTGYDHLYQHWGMNGHNGTDLMAGEQPVFAAMDGVVVEKEVVPARGLGLGILSHTQFDFPEGKHYLKLRYWHLKSFDVEVGDVVKVGYRIGFSDNTGYSSGNHLHFEGQLVDKDAGGHPVTVQLNNGYANAVNIEPYFNKRYAMQFTRDLWFGTFNEDVLELQRRLRVDFSSWPGFFGVRTFNAVRAYQIAKGIPSTGYVGPLTRASLNG